MIACFHVRHFSHDTLLTHSTDVDLNLKIKDIITIINMTTINRDQDVPQHQKFTL